LQSIVETHPLVACMCWMAGFRSRVGPWLLVVGLSSAATFALCFFCIHTVDPAIRATAIRARALSERAPSPLLRNSQTDVSLAVGDFQPRLFRKTDHWGYNGSCVHEIHAERHFGATLGYLHCELSSITFAVFPNHYAVIFAILIDLIWHIVHCRWRGTKLINPFLREVSLAIITFNIFYNPNFPEQVTRNPFICSASLVVIEHAIFILTSFIRMKRTQEGWRQLPGEHPHDLSDLEIVGKNPNDLSDLEIMNRYQMMSTTLPSVFSLFVCQLVLVLFYSWWINNRTESIGWAHGSGLQWFVGALLCNITNQTGTDFDFSFWWKLIRNNKEMKGHWDDDEEDLASGRMMVMGSVRVSYRAQAIFRMLMDFIVNLFIRGIVLFTAPIIMGVSNDSLEFIKDCLAVFFITKLDDLNEPICFLMDLKRKAQHDGRRLASGWLSSLWYFLFDTPDETCAIARFVAMEESKARCVAMEKRIKALELMEVRINALEKK